MAIADANITNAVTKQQIISSLMNNEDQFRNDAHIAYKNYSKSDRELLASIETTAVSSATFLNAWQNSLLPKLSTLANNKNDKTFKDFLATNLLVDPSNVQPKSDEIINQRQHEVIEEFLDEFYPSLGGKKKDKFTKQRSIAKQLLNVPEAEILALKVRQNNYLLYKEIAKQNNITVIDIRDSFFRRMHYKKLIKAELKASNNYIKQRRVYLTKRLKLLSTIYDRAIVELNDKHLDLVSIFDLRHQYEKKLGKLNEAERGDSAKRLAIFNSITDKYKTEQTERLVAGSDDKSLSDANKLKSDLDWLLLTILELSNADKNQLLLYAKEYRELKQELELDTTTK